MSLIRLHAFRPRIGLPLGLGLACLLLILVPSLGAAELIVQAYQARMADDARERAMAGLDAAAGLIEQERIRALNNAEAAAGRLGRLARDGADEALLRAATATRTTLRTSLVAIVEPGGRTLASDPASNVPFASHGEVRGAIQGRPGVNLQDRIPIAVQAAAPLRADGDPLPGAAVVALNLDDTFFNVALRTSGLEMALIQNGRLVAASRGLRRSFAFSSDQSVDEDLLAKPGDTFKQTRLGNETFLLAARGVTAPDRREIGTLLVGLPSEALAWDARQARVLTYGAALSGALAAGLVGAVVGRQLLARLRALAVAARQIGRGGPMIPAADSADGPWGAVGRALAETDAAVAKRLGEFGSRSERLEAVLGSLVEGVIVADERRRVILVNPAARSLLSLPAGGEGGALALIDDARHTAAALELQANERVIRSYSAPVLDDSGQPLGTVTVLRDATREQELDRLKSEFLTVVSHELQTPLTAVKGALELVLEDDGGQLSRVQRRFLDTIDRNCERLVGLVSDLLDLSRLEAGRVELSLQPIDAASLVRDTAAVLANLFDAHEVSVTLRVPDELPPILADRRRAEQILTNLLANAAKYTPAGGQVDVAAWSEEERVAVAVTDSGPGIPEAERELVFDKFYRGRDTARRGAGGSGLGLAIVRSLVALHGGTVRVESGIGALSGARLVVELPRAPEDE